LIFLLFKKIYETHMLKRCLTQRLDENNPESYIKKVQEHVGCIQLLKLKLNTDEKDYLSFYKYIYY